MPSPLEIMEAERRRALEQAEQVEKDMRELERILQRYGLHVAVDPASFVPIDLHGHIKPGAKEAAEAIIRARGHPMAASEIAADLLERGYEFSQLRDTTGAVTAILLKNTRLKYFPKVGWWLRDVSWPPKNREELERISAPQPDEGRPRGRRRNPHKVRLYQELRKFLEGRSDPVQFPAILEHVQRLGIPIGGTNDKANLSSFMSGIHEFRANGPGGRGGWTFVEDKNWSFTEGFKTGGGADPAWRHNPLKLKLYETLRSILGPIAPNRMQLQPLFEAVKAAGVDFVGVKAARQRDYMAGFLAELPCFERFKKAGWRYIPELDDNTEPITLA